MFDSIPSSEITAFLQRIDPAVAAGKTPQEAWRTYLVKNTGLNGNTHELEKAWFAKQGGSGGTLSDLMQTYMHSKGYGGGSVSEKLKNYTKGVVTP